MSNLPERFKIKYEFKAKAQGDGIDVYLLADLDYIDDRFKELKACYAEIAKKIGQINIASRSGALEFAIANSLVSYYSVSAIRLNSKRGCLLDAQKPKRELTELEIKQREEARDKYASRVYTGKLSQGNG